MVSYSVVFIQSVEGLAYWSTKTSSCQSGRTQNYADFEVIDTVDDMNPYPALPRIDQAIDNQPVSKFKKIILSFEDKELWVVTLIDPLEVKIYVEQVNSKGQEEYLDNIYNISSIMGDYVNPKANGDLSW